MASNPTLSQIKVGNVVYDICDTSARNNINTINTNINTINTNIGNINTNIENIDKRFSTVMITNSSKNYLTAAGEAGIIVLKAGQSNSENLAAFFYTHQDVCTYNYLDIGTPITTSGQRWGLVTSGTKTLGVYSQTKTTRCSKITFSDAVGNWA